MSESRPASQRAEEALLGSIFRDPSSFAEVMGTVMLESTHFYFRPYRILFDEIVERHYADEPLDALLVAEAAQAKLVNTWKLGEREVVDRVVALKASSADTSPLELARLVKRHHDYRELLALSERLRVAAVREEDEPDVIAGQASAEAMKIATDMVLKHEIVAYGDLGRRWVETMRRNMAMAASGQQIGAYFGIRAIDEFTQGLLPTELLIAGGEPGVGKSAVWWKAATNFAQSQMARDPDKRIGTLIFSLEMGEEPSSGRFAQSLGHIDGKKLRQATLTREDLVNTAREWAKRKETPLYVNHSGHLRAAQIRALVVEAIRKHNVGLVVIDHFRFVRPDDRMLRGNEADDEIVVFLKTLAKDLNIAVVCLAHTVKSIESAEGRPKMSDLRGSGMIAAFADFVSFVHRPWRHASELARDREQVSETDAEMIWAKSRHSGEGDATFFMNLSTMTIV